MKKIYTDKKTGLNYFFNQEKLVQSYKKYIDKHKIKKGELNGTLSTLFALSEESVRKHVSNKNSPSLIDQIYDYGCFFEGDRYFFLDLYETEESLYEKVEGILLQNDFAKKCVQAVKSRLITIVSEYTASYCYNQKITLEPDLLIHYRKRIDELEVMIFQLYKKEQLVNDLLHITTIIKKFVCSGEYPGAIKELYDINPNLRFYSPAFELMLNDANAFKFAFDNKILDYYPTEKDKNEYLEYFTTLEEDNKKNNFHYNIEDFFQRELIKTINLWFETKIANYNET